jgi:hypothetical protein
MLIFFYFHRGWYDADAVSGFGVVWFRRSIESLGKHAASIFRVEVTWLRSGGLNLYRVSFSLPSSNHLHNIRINVLM